eukprot:323726-Chlamydomonas_euryale.AAC.1
MLPAGCATTSVTCCRLPVPPPPSHAAGCLCHHTSASKMPNLNLHTRERPATLPAPPPLKQSKKSHTHIPTLLTLAATCPRPANLSIPPEIHTSTNPVSPPAPHTPAAARPRPAVVPVPASPPFHTSTNPVSPPAPHTPAAARPR